VNRLQFIELRNAHRRGEAFGQAEVARIIDFADSLLRQLDAQEERVRELEWKLRKQEREKK
jgi:hypothetical protein